MSYQIQRTDRSIVGIYATMRDAVTAFNKLIASNPAPFDNIERHPDFVRFARFERRIVAVSDIALIRI